MTTAGPPLSSMGLHQALNRLENHSSPREFLAAFDAIRASGDPALAAAMEQSHSMEILRKAPRLSDLRCVSEAPLARYYATPDSHQRRLLVAFTGAAQRLMMPLPIIMQALQRETDLLLLFDPSRNHYRRGIWDGEHRFSHLPSLLAPYLRAYADTIAFGTSSGGLPALRFARQAGLRRGLSFGGREIDDTLRILRRENVPPAYDPLCACDVATPTEMILVHAANNTQDAQAARRVGHLANVYPVPLAGQDYHGVLWTLHGIGCLPDLLDMSFSASAPALQAALGTWNAAALDSAPA
jgi:hypothetical protein